VGPELDGSYPTMRIHHVLRGGLIFLGTGIGAMSLTTSAGIGTPSALAADAAGRAGAPSAGEVAGVQAAPVPAAPAATPVVVASWEVEVATVSDTEPERPVVQAGPGPATPVEGATTLIDPLVIER
jgi:hypothetical protein